jgi:cysteine desulfurase / selenocysteine lyase
MATKQEFPILNNLTDGKELVYLDSTATSQKPQAVINAIKKYYETSNANVHRGLYDLADKATIAYEHAHNVIADFINADSEEIIITKGTTESLNLVAYSLVLNLKEGDEVMVSEMEHHSNFVPWQQLAKKVGAILKVIPVTKDYRLDVEKAKELISEKTKIVSIVHMSNVLGTVNPIKELASLVHNAGAVLVVDAAQSAPHMRIDVKELDCDFLAFSGHKMLGPTGIGVLYGKADLLKSMDPFLYGGGMIEEVTLENTTWNAIPSKFEAGTPNIAQAVGLAKAIEYLQNYGMDKVEEHEKELTKYCLDQLQKIEGLSIIGPNETKNRGAVFSFIIDGVHTHDISEILNRYNIAVRAGNHCAMPLHHKFGIQGSTRASFYIYNNKEDVDKLIEGLKKVKDVFK